MKITYDKEVDVLYIKIKEVDIVESEETDKNVIVDYDKDGGIVGIEILYFVKNNKKDFFPVFKEVEKAVWGQQSNLQAV